MFRTILRVSILVGVHFGAVDAAQAAEQFEFYNGVRSLGMGGARIAVVNDETALLVNPAGLGKLRDYIITAVDPEVALGAQTQAIVGASLTDALDPQKSLVLLNQNLGKRLHQRVQVFPSMVVPNFGMGVFGKYVADSQVDATGTTYTFDYVNDYAFVLGYNFRFFDGKVKLGFNMKVINRIEVHRDDLPAASTGLTIPSLASEGLGVGSDVGLIITGPWKMLPTLAAVYRDVGGTVYTLQNGLFMNTATRPVKSEGDVDVALALFPIFGKRTRFSFTTEYRGVLTASDELDSSKRIHVGMELNLADAFFLRAGMHQRYWTAGLEFAMKNYQLQIATYGEEVGTAVANEEARRYVGKFAWRF